MKTRNINKQMTIISIVWLLFGAFLYYRIYIPHLFTLNSPDPPEPFLHLNSPIHNTNSPIVAFIYSYFEGGWLVQKNFEYFIHFIQDNDNINYFIVVNGDKCVPCMNLPRYPNVKLIYRENKGYDFGAWSEILLTIKNRNMYKYFVFTNPTVRGPILEPDFDYNNTHWLEQFTHHLKNNVHLVGPTINCELGVHVQSYFMVATVDAIELAIDNNIFSLSVGDIYEEEKNERNKILQVVFQKEVGFSKLLLRNGYNIGSLMTMYLGHDFTKTVPECLKFNPTFEYLSPTEVIFVKTVEHKNYECKYYACSVRSIDDYSKLLQKELNQLKKKENHLSQI